MAGTRRHGINAEIWMDTSTAGTMAASGTVNLTLVTSKGSWSFDQTRDLVDVTSFGDTSKTNVAGLAGGSGDLSGELDFGDNNMWNAMASSTERALIVYPDATNNRTTFFSGKAFYSPKYAGSTTTAVTQAITFAAGPSGLAWSHP